ncbi:MAG: hypothetical protein AB1597_01220 [Chloroflexota bacterium]
MFCHAEHPHYVTPHTFSPVQQLGVSHCTGFYASVQLAQEFGDRFFLNNSGITITLP